MATVMSLPSGVRPLASGDALVLEGVTRAFGALKAIEDVSFSVGAGERRAVLGANGAGKTTLFNAITGDFPPSAGRVRFFGEDITELPMHDRIRRGLRRTYQSSLLFRQLSVRDNLFLAVRGVSRNRYSFIRPRAGHPSRDATQDLLERVRLTDVADELVASLSHGQQRQLEIGMALAGAPRLILFDEPAAGLSAEEIARLSTLLLAIARAGTGVLLVEHHPDLIFDICHHITVLNLGKTLAAGTPAEIRSHREVVNAYLGG